MTGRTGRPRRSLVEEAANTAQVAYLCFCLALDRQGLRQWLQHRGSWEGGLLERHARAFVELRQTAAPDRAAILDQFAPGIAEITSWPWPALDASRCTRRSLHSQLNRLRRLPQPAYGVSVVRRFATAGTTQVPEPSSWLVARRFFEALLRFRLLAIEEDHLGMAARGGRLLAQFETALNHPAIAAAENVMLPALERALSASLLVSFYSTGSRIGFEHRRKLRLGRTQPPHADQRADASS